MDLHLIFPFPRSATVLLLSQSPHAVAKHHIRVNESFKGGPCVLRGGKFINSKNKQNLILTSQQPMRDFEYILELDKNVLLCGDA
jgi:hypothetical protein